jgi:hypothetical protein
MVSRSLIGKHLLMSKVFRGSNRSSIQDGFVAAKDGSLRTLGKGIRERLKLIFSGGEFPVVDQSSESAKLIPYLSTLKDRFEESSTRRN